MGALWLTTVREVVEAFLDVLPPRKDGGQHGDTLLVLLDVDGGVQRGVKERKSLASRARGGRALALADGPGVGCGMTAVCGPSVRGIV